MPEKAKVCDIIGQDLAGYCLVKAWILELDHQLMGCFPAINKKTKQPVLFIHEGLMADVKLSLPKRRCKARSMLFLLEPGGKSGFVVQGEQPCTHQRCEVLTRQTFEDASTIVEWADGLLSLSD